MAVSEASRHQLYQQIEHLMGHDNAATLMELLPPVGWADVATKHDLAALEERVSLRFDATDTKFAAIDHKFEAMEHKFEAALHREVSALKSTMLLTMLLGQLSLAAIISTALKLA